MLSKSKGGKRTGSTLKVSTTDLPASDGTQMGGNAPDNSESQEYVAARSYIVIELHFSKPLIPKRSEAVLAQRYVYTYMYSKSTYSACLCMYICMYCGVRMFLKFYSPDYCIPMCVLVITPTYTVYSI